MLNQEHVPNTQGHLENHAFKGVASKDFSPESVIDRFNAVRTYLDLDLLDTMLNKHGLHIDQITSSTFETLSEEMRISLASKFSSLTAEVKYIQDKETAASVRKIYTEEIADLLIAGLTTTS